MDHKETRCEVCGLNQTGPR